MSTAVKTDVDAFAQRFDKDAETVLEQMENCQRAQTDTGDTLGTLNKLASRMLNGEQQSDLELAVDSFAKSRGKGFDKVMQQVLNTAFS